jgi:hypothetical protein
MAGSELRRNPDDFFIVDNSDEHWKALEYVRQWCEISESIDIATGYFEIGALLALDGHWQKVDKIRILIGSETSRQTAATIDRALSVIEGSFDPERIEDPFLEGLNGIVQAIASGKIEIRVYKKKKFHAKAYISHGRLEVVGSAALVGSSNFTPPGLTRNVELNVRFTGLEVNVLQDWFLEHWEDGEDIKPGLLTILERHNREWTPFEVYAKALQTLTEGVEQSATEWEKEESKIYPMLAPYQREGYHGLKQRAEIHGGAFLTDGVGLGKTFVGLMLAEYYAKKERKNVLILATKTGEDAVWKPEIKRHLPDLIGDFSNVMTMAHTDLSRQDAMERVNQLAERVDVVIIDEGHNFRNHGSQGDDPENPKSRWWRLEKLCRGKKVFHLTATPINNTLFDFVHEFELFTGLNDAHFAAEGIPSVKNHVSERERAFLTSIEAAGGDAGAAAIDMKDFEQMLHEDKLLESLIVQHSRKYAKESAKKIAGGSPVLFPVTDMPRAVPYDYNMQFNKLLEEIELAFQKKDPLFVLPMYFPLAYSKDKDIDTKLENRQKQVVGLIRTTFLKRFESSIAAFAGSCSDLSIKIANWILFHTESSPTHRGRAEKWIATNTDVLESLHEMFRPDADFIAPGIAPTTPAPEPEGDDNDDELLNDADGDGPLDPEKYDLPAMFDAALEDLTQLGRFLARIHDCGPELDNKFDRLRDLLLPSPKSKKLDKEIFVPGLTQHKVLVFTEYADTARYIHKRLVAEGMADVDRLDGSRKGDRVAMIERFAPYYNRVDESRRADLKPLRVLISTDVLSEGVNLQDAFQIVNYDLHWNPVRLMQRIGRVDRRLDQSTEDAILKARPKEKGDRGRIQIRNFLPPDQLNEILSLYSRVSARVLLISKTLGIPGGKLLDADEILDDTKVFNAFRDEYEGDLSPLEKIRLHYLDLLAMNPGLEDLLSDIPVGAHSARNGESAGLFVCSIEPIRATQDDGADPVWTLEDGKVRWEFHRADGTVDGGLQSIDALIRSEKSEPRVTFPDRLATKNRLAEIRKTRWDYLMKQHGLPLDAPQPKSICWMEIL